MMQKRMLAAGVLIVLAGLVRAQEVANPAVKDPAPETFPVSVEVSLDVASAYVWRGMIDNDEPVWMPDFVVDYSLEEYGRFYVDLFMLFDATRRTECSHFAGLREMDYITGYEVDLGPVTAGIGHIWYTYPQANGEDYDHSTREVFVTAAVENDWVTPFIEVYGDYAIAQGIYAVTGLRKEVAATDQLTVGVEGTLGFGDRNYTEYYFISEAGEPLNSDTSLVDANAGLYGKYAITDHFAVGAQVTFSSLADREIRKAGKESVLKDEIVWTNVNMSYTF